MYVLLPVCDQGEAYVEEPEMKEVVTVHRHRRVE